MGLSHVCLSGEGCGRQNSTGFFHNQSEAAELHCSKYCYRLKSCDIDIADVFPQPMEGYKLMVNKGLSNHFQVSHSLQLSGMGPGSYHFAATYVGSKQISPTEVCVPFSTLYHPILKITVHIQYQEEKYWQLVAFCLLV